MERIGGVREGLIDRRGRTSVVFRIRRDDPSVATRTVPR
jgi:hypothetical protein